jgi:membrane-associated phospholipid phosphatase
MGDATSGRIRGLFRGETGASAPSASTAGAARPHFLAASQAAGSPEGAPSAGPIPPPDPAPPFDSPGRLLAAALILAAAGLAALSVDLRVSRYLFEKPLPHTIRDCVQIAEAFGHGAGVLMILATAFTLAPRQRRMILHATLATLGAGGLANLAKLGVARCRPRAFHFLSENVWDTFGDSFAVLPITSSTLKSFPSAHSATAAALAVMLAWAFPRGRWPFAIFASLACLQRLSSGAHFLSDVLMGAGLGVGFAVAYQHVRIRLRKFRAD